jgi:acetyl-CoA acetyltransferase
MPLQPITRTDSLLVLTGERAEKEGWPVLARIVDHTTSGVDHERVMAAPMPAVETLFELNGLDYDVISFSGEASDADVSLLVCNHTEFAG